MNLVFLKNGINGETNAEISPQPQKTMSGFRCLIVFKIGNKEERILLVFASIISTSSFKKSRYSPTFSNKRRLGWNFSLGRWLHIVVIIRSAPPIFRLGRMNITEIFWLIIYNAEKSGDWLLSTWFIMTFPASCLKKKNQVILSFTIYLRYFFSATCTFSGVSTALSRLFSINS